jgi:O-antigen/teichoic acid export membrane protein
MNINTIEMNKARDAALAANRITKDILSPTHRTIKNSIWLIVHPLILNVISIFATAYIARTLGQGDYGKFIFAFAFVSMFTPITNLGLRAIVVREIAENKGKVCEFAGGIITLRIILSLIAIITIVVSSNMIGYPSYTKIIIYIASLQILFMAIGTTLMDVFQAFEKMEYVAYAQFVSGLILTILSIIVMAIGKRVVGLTMVYVFGSFLLFIISAYLIIKKMHTTPILKINFRFWKTSIYKGSPFFFPNLLSIFGDKIGIILLSSIAGEASVGIYAAGSILVDRLVVIPDSVCTAIFPTLSVVYKNSKEEAAQLVNKFFNYLFLLALPIAIGSTLLAGPIINLIYGAKFEQSVVILRILAWWIFFIFITSIQAWALGSIHQEKKGAKVRFFTVPFFVVMTLILAPMAKEKGVAIASLITSIISFILISYQIRKYLAINVLKNRVLLKIALANIVMAFFVFLLHRHNLFLSTTAGLISYVIMLIALRIIRTSDILLIKSLFFKNNANKL